MTQPSPKSISRRTASSFLALGAVGGAFSSRVFAQAGDYPSHPIELVVAYGAGGGTDVLARAFSDSARKHVSQPITVINKPGASGAIGLSDVLNAKPDGYKIAMLTVELTTLPHVGVIKFSHEDFAPIALLNADPAAITVKADAPWNTIEEFLAAAKKVPGEFRVGNSGAGSIWHLASAALEDKTGTKFNPIPYPGAGPAMLALMGGHIEAVSVSAAEVTAYVSSGKLKTLAVMADKRLKGYESVPTLKERNIDLSISAWRGLGAPKNTPPAILAVLKDIVVKTIAEPSYREIMDKQNMGFAFGDEAAFKAVMVRDNTYFKNLITKLNFKLG
ncbi:Bug family tripartite tricarboxylate transporter substrate binding protein [Rhodoferax sp.]|uniref:Bug family tripartite tricarboxylate transporter substrate binding protein n=1 Tax=Rhodoferax sp. TaxID=50421 RepID=UPI00374C8C41